MSSRKRAPRVPRRGAGRELMFVNAAQIVTCAGPAGPRRGSAMNELEILRDSVVVTRSDVIAAVGRRRQLAKQFPGAEQVDCGGGVLMPALVDSHTHAVFGAPRSTEHEMRALGADYLEIARRGGGIHSSVRDVRERTERELVRLARKRIRRLASYGVGTIEVKSGYGLTLNDELKLLRVIRKLAKELPVRLVPTFLGAHEIPLDHRDTTARRREYVDTIIHEMIPRVAHDHLAVFADVFCETGVYTVAESREILGAARDAGLMLKLHADELTSSGGAELAAELRATSADHLAAISDSGIRALVASGTVATLLPSTQQVALGRLSTPQIVALRFASDAELPALLERADREQLSSDQIKKAIKNWVPDWDRT